MFIWRGPLSCLFIAFYRIVKHLASVILNLYVQKHSTQIKRILSRILRYFICKKTGFFRTFESWFNLARKFNYCSSKKEIKLVFFSALTTLLWNSYFAIMYLHRRHKWETDLFYSQRTRTNIRKIPHIWKMGASYNHITRVVKGIHKSSFTNAVVNFCCCD